MSHTGEGFPSGQRGTPLPPTDDSLCERIPIVGEPMPTNWRVPLSDGGALQVRVWIDTRGSPHLQREPGNPDAPPCCKAVAELIAFDVDYQRRWSVPAFSRSGLAQVVEGRFGGAISEAIPQGERDEILGVLGRGSALSSEIPAAGSAVCPSDPQPASEAGLLNGAPSCCRWEDVYRVNIETGERLEPMLTIYVAQPRAGEVPSGGVNTRDNPATIQYVQVILAAPVTYSMGLRLLFRRGDTWGADDLDGEGNLLTILASGAAGSPIIIGAYTDVEEVADVHDADRFRRPLFQGNGGMSPMKGAVDCGDQREATYRVAPGTGAGILILGGQWIQVQDLSITNFGNGVEVYSWPARGAEITENTPLRGPDHINLLGLRLFENWSNGVAVDSRFGTLASEYADSYYAGASAGGVEASYGVKSVVGEGTLQLKVTVDGLPGLLDIPVDSSGWWPERVCIEDCEVYANGDGSDSQGVNLSLAGLSSRCRVRHNIIEGRVHSSGWPNQCGRYVLGWECPDVSEIEMACIWTAVEGGVNHRQLLTWGSDGIAMHVGGCGHIIENNVIAKHVNGQSSLDTGEDGELIGNSCGFDDGDGIDLKDFGNRTYWETYFDDAGQSQRRLQDLPIVIRNNQITRNQGVGLTVHLGGRGLVVYNNEISYNLNSDPAGILLKGREAINAEWETEYDPNRVGQGPGLIEDIYIYRNMIFKNGYIQTEDGDVLYNDYQRETLGLCPDGDRGGNAIKIELAPTTWAGSIRNIWIVNNTVAYNYNYALSISLPDETGMADEDSYAINDIYLINNIFGFNTGNFDPILQSFDGIQVKLKDDISNNLSIGNRGFLCSLEMHNNCYYNSKLEEVVSINNDVFTLLNLKSYSDTFTWYEQLSPDGRGAWRECTTNPFGDESIDEDPYFVDANENDYHINSSSKCKDSGDSVELIHYETGIYLTFGPDFEYYPISFDSAPDIGADEIITSQTDIIKLFSSSIESVLKTEEGVHF